MWPNSDVVNFTPGSMKLKHSEVLSKVLMSACCQADMFTILKHFLQMFTM